MRELCRQKDIELIEGNLVQDHVHKYSNSIAIGFLKGKSAIRINKIFDRHQGNMFGRNFWSRGYDVSTVWSGLGSYKELCQEPTNE